MGYRKQKPKTTQLHDTRHHLVLQDPHTLKEMERGFGERRPEGITQASQVELEGGKSRLRGESWVLERGEGEFGGCKKEGFRSL